MSGYQRLAYEPLRVVAMGSPRSTCVHKYAGDLLHVLLLIRQPEDMATSVLGLAVVPEPVGLVNLLFNCTCYLRSNKYNLKLNFCSQLILHLKIVYTLSTLGRGTSLMNLSPEA